MVEIVYKLQGIEGLVILLIGVLIISFFIYRAGKSKGRLERRVEALEKKKGE